MHGIALSGRQIIRQIVPAWTVATVFASLCSVGSSVAVAQSSTSGDLRANSTGSVEAVNTDPFKQVRYRGTPILIHLPTSAARALVMPEPVTLKGSSGQMPGVELAYKGDVVGFFATRDFARRTVSFIGTESGTEYQLRIRASEFGIVEPLEIIR